MAYVERTDEELLRALRESAERMPRSARIALGGKVYSWPEFFAEPQKPHVSRYLAAMRQGAWERNEDPLAAIARVRPAE